MKDIAYTDFSTNASVLVPLTITGEATGARNLLQKVILLMFTDDKDSSRYAGGGLYANYKGANIPKDKTDLINNFVQSALVSVRDDIKAYQVSQTGLSDDDKLNNITLESISMGDDLVSATISIVTESGATATGTTTI